MSSLICFAILRLEVSSTVKFLLLSEAFAILVMKEAELSPQPQVDRFKYGTNDCNSQLLVHSVKLHSGWLSFFSIIDFPPRCLEAGQI